jgi:glycosyltransferase involved in cell wall biosynthesis
LPPKPLEDGTRRLRRRLGPRPLLQPLINRIGLAIWRRELRRRVRAGTASVDAATPITIDPRAIDSQIPRSDLPLPGVAVRDVVGWVLDGDWDRAPRPLAEHAVFAGVHQRFGEGREWERTSLYRAAAEGLESGRPLWKFRTPEDLPRLFAKIDHLHATIARDGYCSQESLGTRRSWDELLVAIDRDGRIHLVDGAHRLAIAQVLGLEAVPALVGVRHRLWEARRRGPAAGGGAGPPHPDLAPPVTSGRAIGRDATARTVVFVSAVTGHGGPNASLRVVLPRLRGVRPVLVGPYDDAERAEWRAAGVAVEAMRRPRGARGLLVAALRLATVLWRHRAERPLLFANGLTEAAVAAPALAVFRPPAMVWIHNYVPPRPALAAAPLLARLARRRTQLAAVSQVAAAVGRQVFGKGVEIAVLPNPIEQVGAASADRRGIDEPRLRVAYVAGTDRRYKGFDLLPDIVAAADGCPLDWLIVAAEATQPDAWRRLREVIERLTTSTVTIRGRTERVEELYGWTDVVLIPSRQESFCRVAAEGMARGAAVVTARLPAVEEVCGDVAFYFPPEDTVAAAAVLRRLAGSRHLLAGVGERGVRRAERFAPQEVVERLEALLAAVGGGGS